MKDVYRGQTKSAFGCCCWVGGVFLIFLSVKLILFSYQTGFIGDYLKFSENIKENFKEPVSAASQGV